MAKYCQTFFSCNFIRGRIRKMPLHTAIYAKRIPAVKIVACIIIGILWQSYTSLSFAKIIAGLSISVALMFLYYVLPVAYRFTLQYWLSIPVASALVFGGSLLYFIHQKEHDKWWIGNQKGITTYTCTISEPLQEKAKTYKTIASVYQVKANGSWEKATGKILLYIYKDNLPPSVNVGDTVIISKPWQIIQNMGNPGSFDYQKFINRKGIYHHVFLGRNDMNVLPNKSTFTYTKVSQALRSYILQIIDKNVVEQREKAIVKALLISYKADMDDEIMESFRDAGVIHIIAISGLHVGMIALLLSYVFSPLRRFRYGKAMSTCFVLSGIWLFACIAGLTPSATRAAIMFSFLTFGVMMGKPTNSYNTLAASAICLLIIQPEYLWDVGFQLSYAAVFSIVFFYKAIFEILYVENVILKYIWSVLSLSIAAQLMTMPIILYHFHQFPNTFLLANLVAVPLAACILYGSISMVLLDFLPWIPQGLGWLVGHLVLFLNRYIYAIATLPFAVTDGIYINVLQAILLLVTICSIYFFLQSKKFYLALLFLFSLSVFFTIGYVQSLPFKKQKRMVLYNIPQSFILDFFDANHYQSIQQQKEINTSIKAQEVLMQGRNFYQAQQTNSLKSLRLNFPFIHFYDKRIFVLNAQSAHQWSETLRVDYVFVDNYYHQNLIQLIASNSQALFVIANTNSLWKTQQWKSMSKNLHLRCFVVREQGAFVETLQ